MINQEGRPIKVHANRLYRQNLPATDKRSENLPKEYQDQTQDKRRTYLPTDDSGETADIPDGEQPQESSSYYDETPTCSISSSILNRDLPPPPDSGRLPRPTNHRLTGAQLCASTSDNHQLRVPPRGATSSTLNRDLPPPPDSGHQSQPTNHGPTCAQPCAPTSSSHQPREPTRRATSSTLRRGLPPPTDNGRQPRPTNRERAGAKPYAAINENHYGKETSHSTSGGTLIDAHRNMGPQPEGSGQPLEPSHQSMDNAITRRLHHRSIEAQGCSTDKRGENGEQPQPSEEENRMQRNKGYPAGNRINYKETNERKRYRLRTDQTPYYRDTRLYTPRKRRV